MEFSAVILSGGKSLRMGKDKGLMLFKGKPMISYAIMFFQNFTSNIIISTNNIRYQKFGYKLVSDNIPNLGPIGGFYSVMSKVESDFFFISACDMPYLSPEIAKKIISSINGFDIAVPVFNHRTEPLFCLYSRKILPVIEQQIKKGDYKLMNLLRNCNTNYVNIAEMVNKEHNPFNNINTPGDAQ